MVFQRTFSALHSLILRQLPGVFRQLQIVTLMFFYQVFLKIFLLRDPEITFNDNKQKLHKEKLKGLTVHPFSVQKNIQDTPQGQNEFNGRLTVVNY